MAHEPYSFAALHNRLTVNGTLVARTALRIGAGRASDVIGNDLPVLRDAVGAPLVPGASLKGSLRAQLEALIRAVAPGQARDLLKTEDVMRGEIPQIREERYLQEVRKNRDSAHADRSYSEAIWSSEISTMIDLTFGAPWIAGRLFLKDALVDRNLWFGQFEVRNGVALNRDTETAENGLLYDYEVVPAGTRFGFELVLENAEDWQLGMVVMALQPWERGEVQIGGFRTRGLGHVQLIDTAYRFATIKQPDDVLRLLCDTNTLEQLALEPLADTIDDQKRGWYEAFRQELKYHATKS